MNRKDLNKIMSLMRITDEVRYNNLKKKIRKGKKDVTISDYISKRLEQKDILTYHDVKISCPVDQKIGNFLYEVVVGSSPLKDKACPYCGKSYVDNGTIEFL